MSQSKKTNIGMAQTILKRAELSPDTQALTFEGKSQTFAEFGERIRRIAGVLRDGGVCQGDRVGYLGLNHPCFLETLYACGCLGAIFVPLNFRLTGPEVRFIANDAGVQTMLGDDNFIALIDDQKNHLHCRRYISIEDDAKGWDRLEILLTDREPLSLIEQVSEDDIALIMYTSGTTGLPKGAMLTHGNIFWNTVNVCFIEENMKGASLTCAPLFHIGGLNVTTHASLAKGIEVILHRSFDPGSVLQDIEKYKVSTMFGAPTMFLMMAQHEAFEAADFSSIISVTCGAAPVPVSLIETYAAKGVSFCQGYGLTETAPFASILSSNLATKKIGSAGLAPMYTELRIVDNDNNPLRANERGEVCIKGPNVMKGYWNRPDATAEAIDELGWFHSGDIGYLDQEGFLYICDRVKDMVITGGENVYPAEIENILYGHKAVAEVAVVGMPDDKWGEAVVAVVALNPDTELSLEELRKYAEPKLARYKLPSRLHIVDILPRNPAGKVQKFLLREQLAKG